MSRVQAHDIDKKLRYQMIGDFYDIVAHLKSKKDVANFFMGVLTTSEGIMVARRIQIAKLLLQGNSYTEISDELGAGEATIAEVSQWLNSENEGFRIEIMKHVNREKKWKGNRKNIYDRILSPYGQLKIVKELFE